MREYHDITSQIAQIGVRGDATFLFAFLAGSTLEEAHNVADGFQRTAQVKEFLFLHVHPFHADAFQRWTYIEEILVRKFVFFLDDTDEFGDFFQSAVDFIVRFGESHVVHPFLSQGAETFLFQQLTDGIESNFLLKILRIYHVYLYLFKICGTKIILF